VILTLQHQSPCIKLLIVGIKNCLGTGEVDANFGRSYTNRVSRKVTLSSPVFGPHFNPSVLVLFVPDFTGNSNNCQPVQN
jgi:hypothetical protein